MTLGGYQVGHGGMSWGGMSCGPWGGISCGPWGGMSCVTLGDKSCRFQVGHKVVGHVEHVGMSWECGEEGKTN